MTLDDLERLKGTLAEKSFFAAHEKKLNEDSSSNWDKMWANDSGFQKYKIQSKAIMYSAYRLLRRIY